MKIQLETFEHKFNAGDIVVKDNPEDFKIVSEYVEQLIDKMKPNKSYLMVKLFKLHPFTSLDKLNNRYSMSSSNLGWVLVNNDRIKWINCSCGGTGKYRRIK